MQPVQLHRGSTRVLALATAFLTALTMFFVAGGGSEAQAEVNQKIKFTNHKFEETNFQGESVNDGVVEVGNRLKFSVDYDATQAGAKPGDSFVVKLPSAMALREEGTFPMKAADGTIAGTCELKNLPGDPWYKSVPQVTCTFNDAIKGMRDVAGTVSVGLSADDVTTKNTGDVDINGKVTPVPLPYDKPIVAPKFKPADTVGKWADSLKEGSKHLHWTIYAGGPWLTQNYAPGETVVISDKLGSGHVINIDPGVQTRGDLAEVCPDPTVPHGYKSTVVAKVGENYNKGFTLALDKQADDKLEIRFSGPFKADCNYNIAFDSVFPSGKVNKGQIYENTGEFVGKNKKFSATMNYVQTFSATVTYRKGYGSFKVVKLVAGDGFPENQKFDVTIDYKLPDGKSAADFPGWTPPSNPTKYTVTVGEGTTYAAAFPEGTKVTLTEEVVTANPVPVTGIWGNYKFTSNDGGVTLSDEGRKASFTIVDQKTVALDLTNTWNAAEFGAFKITKKVAPEGIAAGKEFNVTYVCDSMGNRNTPATGKVAIRPGEETTVGEFPVGTNCKVTEESDVVIDEFTLTSKDLGTPVVMAKGDNLVTVTNNYKANTVPVSVGDYVWFDANRDGQQNAGEKVVPGVKVTLIQGGQELETTTTGEDGYYNFKNLTSGQDYQLKFTLPEGATWTTKDQGDDATDSDVDEAGMISFTAPAAGNNQIGPNKADNPTLDAGLIKYNLRLTKTLDASSKSVVYGGDEVTFNLTPHNDGPVDALAGWSVTEVLPEGLSLKSMSGEGYTCENGICTAAAPLKAGADGHVIKVVATVAEKLPLASFDAGLTNVAYVAPAPTDAPETVPLGPDPGKNPPPGTPTDNDDDEPIKPGKVSIGDYVWFDSNRDGLQSDGEQRVAGVKVVLTTADGAKVSETATDADGYYNFRDLIPGAAYKLQFTAPEGAKWTTHKVSGGDDAKNSDVDENGALSFNAPGAGKNEVGPNKADNPTLDAGLIKYNLVLAKSVVNAATVHVGDVVTFELTPRNEGPADAIAGWSVTDLLPKALRATEITGEGYKCEVDTLTCVNDAVLKAGATGKTITVKAEVVADFNGVIRNLAYVSPNPKDALPETNPLTKPEPKDPTNTDVDTPSTPTDNDASADVTTESRVSVGDYVWLDVNRDGLQGDAKVETPVSGVKVVLLDANGKLVTETRTNEAGYYWFNNLIPGAKHQLQFTAPDGATWTKQDAGDDRADSDVDAKGMISFTAPAAGTNGAGAPDKTDNPTLDAGLVKLNLKLVKTLDENSKSVVYGGDEITFNLTPHNDGPVDSLPGWTITEVLPEGLTLVSMTGEGYKCDGTVCTAEQGIKAGQDGPVLKVVAKVDEVLPLESFVNGLNNIAYISPAPNETPEIIPLDPDPGKNPPPGTPSDNDDDEPVNPGKVSIGDYVWVDVDRDGQQDAEEKPVGGIKVTLKDQDGNVVGETVTDEGGFYFFKDLLPNRDYQVTFIAPEGATFTGQNQGDDATDSDPAADGAVSVKTPIKGENLTEPGKTDDPTIDAGLVKINLVLKKDRSGSEAVKVGDLITYTLTPSNRGPVNALPGWSVTDVLPEHLELVSISGEGYTCDASNPKAPVCTSDAVLKVGESGKPVTVVVKVGESAQGVVRNVGYVAPAPGETPETNPLPKTPPAAGEDTTKTATDNDDHKDVVLTPQAPKVKPNLPDTGN